MTIQQFEAGSLEPLVANDIKAFFNNTNIDPTPYLIEFALTDTTTQAGLNPTTWVTGAWQTNGPPYNGWVMVGPGSTLGAFAQGTTWRAWWRITVSASEKPIHQFGFAQFI